jgi:HSP20 family protein
MTLYISPYRRLSSLREAMDRLLEENLPENAPSEREMVLAVDVTDVEDAYTITALVPGLDAEHLNIEILNNTVTLRGEFRRAAGEKETKFLTCELPEGRFSRVITLPVAVDSSKAEASLKNGVLMLQVPKADVHRPKSIKVNIG